MGFCATAKCFTETDTIIVSCVNGKVTAFFRCLACSNEPLPKENDNLLIVNQTTRNIRKMVKQSVVNEIQELLREYDGCVNSVANRLGYNRTTIYKYLRWGKQQERTV